MVGTAVVVGTAVEVGIAVEVEVGTVVVELVLAFVVGSLESLTTCFELLAGEAFVAVEHQMDSLAVFVLVGMVVVAVGMAVVGMAVVVAVVGIVVAVVGMAVVVVVCLSESCSTCFLVVALLVCFVAQKHRMRSLSSGSAFQRH